MSVFVCKSCEQYIDSDFHPCHANDDYDLFCDKCVIEMSVGELIDNKLTEEIECRRNNDELY